MVLFGCCEPASVGYRQRFCIASTTESVGYRHGSMWAVAASLHWLPPWFNLAVAARIRWLPPTVLYRLYYESIGYRQRFCM
jgi:hypothetical protein